MKRQTVAEYVREHRDHRGKPMQTFEINGKKIKTNLGDWKSVIWNGNDVPMKYGTNQRAVGFGKTMNEVFEDLVNEGYTEIRFVEVTTCVRGYHRVYAWYC